MTEEDFQKFWVETYNTKLSAQNEKKFQSWLKQTKEKYGVDLVNDLLTYDLRGFWLDGGYKDEAFRQRRGHAPDKYKKPSHPTFSTESIYNGVASPYGSKWQGGTWHSDTDFEPSAHMLRYTHPINWYSDYMKRTNKDVRLRLPHSPY